MEQAAHHNLPNILVVNGYYATPKAKRVPIILINTTDQDFWVRQPSLAAALFEPEVKPKQYNAEMKQEGDKVIISFQLVLLHEGEEPLKSNVVEAESNNEELKDLISAILRREDYNFEEEIERLPFKFNLGEAPFTKEQQD